MKLYTEEQVLDAISKAFRYNSNVEILKSLTPIELPSDEEIEERVGQYHYEMHKYGFRDGAKWIREQLKNQQP